MEIYNKKTREKSDRVRALLEEFNEKDPDKDLSQREVAHSCGIEEIFFEESPDDLVKYEKALNHGKAVLKSGIDKISIDLLNKMHGILMKGKADTLPGQIRDKQVYIGQHTPPPPEKVEKVYDPAD